MSERAITGDMDTAKLIAQARRWDPDGELGKQFWALAAALEAAEAERDEECTSAWTLAKECAAFEAENRRLREALAQIASDIHPARPVDEERPRWLDENSVWWNHLSPQEIARAALAGSGDDE